MARRSAVAWPASGSDGLVPRRRASVHGVEIDSESVLYDARSRRLHLLNWSASAVWWSIDGNASVEELATDLAERFAASHEVMRTDLLQLLGVLGEQELVEAVSAPSPKATHG